MKNAKRLAALFLTAAVLLTAGCSRKTVTSQNSVWFIAKSTNTEFWKSAFAGANAAKSEYNVDLTICGPETEEDYEEQNRLIDEAVAAGADAIVYSAISYTKNAEAITRAAKQGLKIAVIDSDVDSDGVGVRIGTDNVEAGRMAGRAEHAQDGVPETDFGRRVEVGVHRGHLADGHAEDAAAGRGVVQQEGVLERHGERDAVAFFEVGDAQRVVEVAVGVGRQDGSEPVFGDEIVERGVLARVAVAGVDDDGFERVVPDDIGVFLDRIELQAGYFHGAGVFLRFLFPERQCGPDAGCLPV